MIERLIRILVKELIQVLRDPKLRMMVLGAPVIQLIVFGVAVSTDVEDVSTAVVDEDGSQTSRRLADRLGASSVFSVEAHPLDAAEASSMLFEGDVRAVVHIPAGFEGELLSGETAEAQILLDGTDSIGASVAAQSGSRILARTAAEALRERLARTQGVAPPAEAVRLEARSWFNENLESRLFYLPGVIALILTLVTLMLTSLSVVREKEVGTLEQLMVTPIRPRELVLGKTLPFGILALLDATLVLLAAVVLFGIPVRGSVALLYASMMLFILSTLGVGLLISTTSSTQRQAMMTMFFFMLPAILLSGFAFPVANMPGPVQWLTLLNPLRHFLEIIRGILLKGIGAEILWDRMLALFVIGAGMLALASARFRKTVR